MQFPCPNPKKPSMDLNINNIKLVIFTFYFSFGCDAIILFNSLYLSFVPFFVPII